MPVYLIYSYEQTDREISTAFTIYREYKNDASKGCHRSLHLSVDERKIVFSWNHLSHFGRVIGGVVIIIIMVNVIFYIDFCITGLHNYVLSLPSIFR